MIDDELKNAIEGRIKEHHKLYELPVIGEYWEEIFARSIEDVEGYSDWKPNRSHAIGKDQICTINGLTYKISNKSGKYNPTSNTLQISGSRSGDYKTLKQKLRFFSDKQEDVYVCLSTNTKKTDTRKYYLISFDTKILDYSEADWQPKFDQSGKRNGWVCETDKYKASIQQSLSGQLWTTLKLESANIQPEVIEID